tara:strand:+ start:1589 stop:2092 length:504 start_codon:yes stop_codon:yes gene_type:complete
MKYILIGMLFIFSVSAIAETDSKREQVEDLLELMDTSSIINSMYSQMEIMLQNMSKELGVKPSEKVIFDEYYSKMVNVMREEMSWAKMKEPMINIYMNNFNEKEISDVIAFYKSDTGQAFIAKTPKLTQESMQIGQNLTTTAIPRIREISKQLKQQLALARDKRTNE